MPYKPAKPCRLPGCVHTTLSRNGYCEAHEHFYNPPEYAVNRLKYPRMSAASRGYGHGWQEIRRKVLAEHGIPEAEWPLYDVHHTPDYNPALNPDHNAYILTPMLHHEHSAHTGRDRGIKSLADSSRDHTSASTFCSCKSQRRP